MSLQLNGVRTAAQSVGASSTSYVWLSTFNATESNISVTLLDPRTFVRISFLTTGAQPGDGSLVATLRKNGVDTDIVLTIAAGAPAGVYTSASFMTLFASGDVASIKLVNNSSSTSATITEQEIVFQNTETPAPLIIPASTTLYSTLDGGSPIQQFSQAEASIQRAVGFDVTTAAFAIRTSTAQPASGDLVATIRQESGVHGPADTATVVTIPANSAAGVFSSTTPSAIVAGSKVSIKWANGASAKSAQIEGFEVVRVLTDASLT